MPLNKDWREFLELLNSNEVEYLVIGAFAVAFHGFPRSPFVAAQGLSRDICANRSLRSCEEIARDR
jgi:hypothetical protein